VTIRPADGPAEVAAAQALRLRVFCDEQGVSRSAELDGLDDEALHLVAIADGSVVATCRLRFAGGDCKLERMAVGRRERGTGLGGRLLRAAEREARLDGAGEMLLHSQTGARGFYESAGYAATSEDVFLEDGIEHVRMRKAL